MPTVRGTSEWSTGRNREMKIAGPPRRRRYRSERSHLSSPSRWPRRDAWILGPRNRPSQKPTLSPMRAPMTTASPRKKPSSGRGHRGAGDDHHGVAGNHEPDENARLQHHRDTCGDRPDDRIDALHGIEQP